MQIIAEDDILIQWCCLFDKYLRDQQHMLTFILGLSGNGRSLNMVIGVATARQQFSKWNNLVPAAPVMEGLPSLHHKKTNKSEGAVISFQIPLDLKQFLIQIQNKPCVYLSQCLWLSPLKSSSFAISLRYWDSLYSSLSFSLFRWAFMNGRI